MPPAPGEDRKPWLHQCLEKEEVMAVETAEPRRTNGEGEGEGGRCSVLLELHVVRRAHLHRSLAHIFPVGAQDCPT